MQPNNTASIISKMHPSVTTSLCKTIKIFH